VNEGPAVKKKVVVFTGAGVSAESGLKTFRDADGLWEGWSVEDVATPEAWQRDPKAVLRFYNERRQNVIDAVPNAAHDAIVSLEAKYEVVVVTQNIDDLHERAGSSRVIHLHGEIRKAQSSLDSYRVYPIDGARLEWGERCELGSQLRPFVVWFGEAVPMMAVACEQMSTADVVIVVGSSLSVYPAAGLVDIVRRDARKFLIDPKPSREQLGFTILSERATVGVPRVCAELLM
jgi:NAD-dependent deacetylase